MLKSSVALARRMADATYESAYWKRRDAVDVRRFAKIVQQHCPDKEVGREFVANADRIAAAREGGAA